MTAGSRWLPVAILAVLLVSSVPALGAPPEAPDWGEATLEGGPVGLGFLGGGFFAYGVTDSGTSVGQSMGPCDGANQDADLYLMSSFNGSGCLQAIDTAGTETDQEGITALTTSERAHRVVVGIPPSDALTATSNRLIAYDMDEEQLSQAWATGAQGRVLLLDADAAGQRTAAAVRGGDQPATASYHLNAYAPNGQRTDTFRVEGNTRALDLSENARYAAVGGNTTAQNASVGWIQLYDLSKPRDANPVLERVFDEARASIVESVAVSDTGIVYAGARDGTVHRVGTDLADGSHDVGNATAEVAVNPSGTVAIAGAGDRVARLSVADGGLNTTWTRTVAGTVASTFVKGAYTYAIADETHAWSKDGQPLWTTVSGTVATVNKTGRALAVADPAQAGATGQTTSTVTARRAHAAGNLMQVESPAVFSPGDVGLVNLTLENDGAAILNGSLARASQGGPTVQFTPGAFTVLPGSNRTVQATVSVPETARPGLRELPVELRSRPFVEVATNLTFDVGTATNVSAALEPGTIEDQAVAHGQEVRVRFLVKNTGNADATVTLGVQQALTEGTPWPTTLDPRGTITVARGTTTTVTLDVTVPSDAPNGTTNRLVFRARTDAGASASTLTLTVNPFEALSLTPQTITKQMAPGVTSSYTFQLANLGSIPTNVTLDAQPLDDEGAPFQPATWGVVLDRSTLRVDAGERRDLRLEITGPRNVTNTTDTSLRVQVLAVSDGETRASALAFGVVDPALAPDDDDEPKREPLGLAVPLAAITAGAALYRRSRHGNL